MNGAKKGGPMNPSAVANHFRAKGWTVSTKESRDLCPECERKKLAANNRRQTPMKQEAQLKAVEPRQMSREDKRIIFEKLSEVYVGEDVGYADEWTDDRVAKDLGVPRKWVEDIRAEFFGEAKSSAELRRDVTRLTAELAGLSEKVELARKELDRLARKFGV